MAGVHPTRRTREPSTRLPKLWPCDWELRIIGGMQICVQLTQHTTSHS